MKKKMIEKVFISFSDENGPINDLNKKFYGTSFLLQSLINKYLNNENFKLISIEFKTQSYFDKFPEPEKNYIHFYNGPKKVIRCYPEIDLSFFNNKTDKELIKYIWTISCEMLKKAFESTKKDSLINLIEDVYKEGNDIDLNTTYCALNNLFTINSREFNAKINYHFKDKGARVYLSIYEKNTLLWELKLDETDQNYEFFFEMFKKIEYTPDYIIIKGDKDVEYLPLKIKYSEFV